MPVTIRVKYNNFPVAAAVIKSNAPKIVENYMRDDLKPAAKPHVDTGALMDSGTVSGGGNSFTLTFTGGAATGWGGEPRVYAAYHEYGTRVTGAYPFLMPAVVNTFPSAVEARVGQLIEGL